MTCFFHSLAFFLFCFVLHSIINKASAWGPIDPTEGFISLPLNRSYYHIQKPYTFRNPTMCRKIGGTASYGVHKLWVFSTDKPHTLTSQTKPRTKIAIQGYNYSSGVWQFEGYAYVPYDTTGVCIMQVFGPSTPHATTLMLRVYNGSLMYYRGPALVPDMYNKWFRLNVIHDVGAGKVKVFIDGVLKLEADGRGAHLMPSNVVSMHRMRIHITWSLGGKALRF